MNNILQVYQDNYIIGELRLTKNKLFEFEYSTNWLNNKNAFPLSIRLPLKSIIFNDDYARPFFENLLPEFNIRNLIARQFGISEKNIFSILEKIGGECAGAISLNPPNQDNTRYKEYQLLTKSELEIIINELPKHPLMADQNLRLSLAGVQNKLPIYISNNKFYLSNQAKPSSHILKPPIKHFPNTVINEYFCMMVAKKIGLPIPEVDIINFKYPVFIIKRFDRNLDQNNNLTRLHQEDFCQAMGILSEQKYENEGGPSIEQCFELIRKFSINPANDLENLLKLIIFNYIIGNCDAHGKNLAFIITKDGPYLSPFYDIICTSIYPELSNKLAMKIGKENRIDWIQARHWQKLAKDAKFTNKYLKQTMDFMITTTPKAIIATANNIKLDLNQQKIIYKILEFSKKTINKLQQNTTILNT